MAEFTDIPGGKLAKALANAIVLADSKGDIGQAAKILDGAQSSDHPGTTSVERIEALAYLAELYVRLDNTARARELLRELGAEDLSLADRERAGASTRARPGAGKSLDGP